jgi:hypothetical protein
MWRGRAGLGQSENKTMKEKLDIAKIAKALGAERRGRVDAKGGTFGAMSLLADVHARSECRKVVVERPIRSGRNDGW